MITNKPAILTDFAFIKDFTKAYIECMLWSSTGTEEEEFEFLDEKYSIDDLSPEALTQINKDIADFMGESYIEVSEAYHKHNVDASQFGHDFWLSRNGHGTGFWDRPEVYTKELADKLNKKAKKFHEIYAYVGDDEKIYFG
jgi:hypothetical protein